MATGKVTSNKWYRIAEERTTEGQTFDKTVTVESMSNFNEVMFTAQSSNGRTFASSIIPYTQFDSGAIYIEGTPWLRSDSDTSPSVCAVAVWQSATSVEIACNRTISGNTFKFRIFGR